MFRQYLVSLVFVAAITGVFCVAVRVAGFASYQALVTMIQGKGVFHHLGRRPACCAVAAFALQAENTGMNLRLPMAGSTLDRCSAENPVDMACHALGFHVGTFQGEEPVMVKIAHPVNPIMAGKAICIKLILVLGHEGSIFCGMTIHAKLEIKADLEPVRRDMAARASQQLVCVISRVAVKAEPGLFKMIENVPGEADHCGPVFRRVAGFAIGGK